MVGHSTDDSVMLAATLAQSSMHPLDAMSNTDINSVFLGQFRYATEYICPLWTFRPDNLFVQATTLHSNTSSYLPAVSAGYQGRPPPNGSRKAPTYTVRVRCALVFVVTQPDSLPFCPHHRGYYGTVRHHHLPPTKTPQIRALFQKAWQLVHLRSRSVHAVPESP